MSFKAAGRLPAIFRLLFSPFALGVVDGEAAASGGELEDGTQDDDDSTAGAVDGSEGETAAATDDDAPGDEDEAIAVAIGAEPSPGSEDNEELIDGKPAPQWVKDLRQKAKDDARELRELRAKVATVAPPAVAEIDPGEKPTLEGCDFNAEKFESDLAAWMDKKAKADQAKRDAEAKAKADKDAWQAKLNAYNEAGAALKVSDFQDAQDAATAALSPVQQAIIINGAGKPALLVYALGKDPAKLKELAAITDPVKFAFAAANIEKDIRVQPRKKQIPAPETRLTGSAGTAHVDGTLERLRKDAERTGDYTKVTAYKRAKKAGK